MSEEINRKGLIAHRYTNGRRWLQLIDADDDQIQTAKVRLASEPGVLYIEENHPVRYSFNPNDQYFPGNGQYASSRSGLVDQWGLVRIGAQSAWDITRQRAGGIVIAVVDTGVDISHPDLRERLFRNDQGQVIGFNALDGTGNAADNNGHGTHVAGIAAAATNNLQGVAGIAFSTSLIMPIKVLNKEGSGTDYSVAQGIIWAVDHGAKIINLSLGSTSYSHGTQLAINYAWLRGALVVAAAGNEGQLIVEYPAGCNLALGVGSTEEDGTTSDFSNSGRHVDCVAPGSNYLSTMPTYPVYLTETVGFKQNYDALNGTSMATPVVSGLAGLLWATYPNATNAQIRTLIVQTCSKLNPSQRGWSAADGYGEVRADRAILQQRTVSGLGSVSGQVIDAAGLPVKGARVSTGALNLTTDESGGFRLANLKSDTLHTISVTGAAASGMRTAVSTVPVPDNADADITVVLK